MTGPLSGDAVSISGADALDALDELSTDPTNLAELESGVRALAQRIDDVEYQSTDAIEAVGADLTDLREQVDELVETVDELVAKAKEEPPPPAWWSTRADGDDWDELAGWVDTLRLSTSLNDKHVVAECWPAHRGVVEELAALHTAWKLAVITDAQTRKAGTAAYTAWFERWLWPCLERITSPRYTMVDCRRRAHRPDPVPVDLPTDRSLFPPGLTRRQRG